MHIKNKSRSLYPGLFDILTNIINFIDFNNVGILQSISAKMRKFIVIIISIVGILISCSSNHHNYENPNLLDIKVDLTIDMHFPEYNSLRFPGNTVYIPNYGNGGIIIRSNGADNYSAFDAYDPNIPYSESYTCAILEIGNLEGTSNCVEKHTYNLSSGAPVEGKSEGDNLEFGLKPYNVIPMGGGILRIKN